MTPAPLIGYRRGVTHDPAYEAGRRAAIRHLLAGERRSRPETLAREGRPFRLGYLEAMWHVERFLEDFSTGAPSEPATAPETPAAPTPLADPPGPATAPPAPQDGALRAPRVYNVPSPRLPPRIPADHRAEVERACAGDLALAMECSTTTPWDALVARVKGLVKQRTIDQIEREGDRRALQDRESFRLRLTHALDAPHYTSEAEILERVRQLATWGRSR